MGVIKGKVCNEVIMDRQRYLHNEMRAEIERCEHLHRKLSIEYKFLPRGTLVTDSNNNIYRYVKEDGKQYKIMLRNSDWKLLRQLKKRRYIGKGLKILKQRIENCKQFLKNDILYDPKSIEKQLPKQYSGLKGIHIFLEGDVNVDDWVNASYRTNPLPIKTPNYTSNNLCTRSKSEAMIATRADDRKLLYRYDAEVILGDKAVYPDFTFLDLKRRRIIYLEHLGKVDDEKYMFRNLKKLEEYAECGIVLGDNLFITYESRNRPLSIKDIDDKLNEMFS